MGRGLTPDQRATRLASRQHGAITLTQALKAGLTEDQVRRQLRSGRWRRVARGVFVMSGAPETWQQAAMVACLAGPPGTVASHLTAAALFGLAKPPPVPHVTVPKQASGRFKGAVVHHALLAPTDASRIGTIPCTRPARIIVDSAALLGFEAVCELLDDALCRSLTTPERLRRTMARVSRAPGRKGLANLERALAVWTPGPLPGSPAEMRLLRRLQQWGFPVPIRQYELYDEHGKLVARMDFGWPDWKIGFEYQGERHHGPRRTAHDRERKARIEALGWQVEYVYKSDLRPGSTRLQRWLAARLDLASVA